MSYMTQAKMAQDAELMQRIAACVATQDPAPVSPLQWAADNQWHLCADTGWDGAWASALAASNPWPGRDEAVITDYMILVGVQARLGELASA